MTFSVKLPLSPGLLFLPGLLQLWEAQEEGGVWGWESPLLSVRDTLPLPLPSRAPSPHPSPARIKLLPLFSPHPEALSSRYFPALRRTRKTVPRIWGSKGLGRVGGRVPLETPSSKVLCWWGGRSPS